MELVIDPHYVPLARISELGNEAQLPAYRTMVRSLEPESVTQNRLQLEDLFSAFGKQRQIFIDLLYTRACRPFCIGKSWRTLRDKLVADKYKSPSGLQARQWKMALQTAAATMSNYWRLNQTLALKIIRQKAWYGALNKLEQRYILRILGSLSIDFFAMLDGRFPHCVSDTENEKVGSRRGLCKAMLRTIREVMGRRPKHDEDNSVWFDSCCYKARVIGDHVKLDLMSLTAGKRITLIVKGRVPVSSTLKLVRKEDGAMALHVQKALSKAEIKPLSMGQVQVPKGYAYCHALDIGFTEVAVNDAGEPSGMGFGERLARFAKYLDAKLKERNQLEARAMRVGEKKRRHILRCNLGEKTFKRAKARMKVEIRNIVNRAINDIFRKSPAQVYALEDLTHRFVVEGKYSREARNMLSKWVRGIIHERFLFKAASKGVQVVFVPAAYSSQHCPECGYTSRENRKGDAFCCQHCGHKAHADHNAARNLLFRVNDSEYKRYMTKEAVRKLERGRYEQWCRNRQQEPLEETVNRPQRRKAA